MKKPRKNYYIHGICRKPILHNLIGQCERTAHTTAQEKNGPSSTSGWHDVGLPVMLSTPSQQQSCRKDAIGSAMLINVMTTADKAVNA